MVSSATNFQYPKKSAEFNSDLRKLFPEVFISSPPEAESDLCQMARTPLLQPQFGFTYAVIFCLGFLVEFGRNLSVSSFR